jgi:hypothetical protein
VPDPPSLLGLAINSLNSGTVKTQNTAPIHLFLWQLSQKRFANPPVFGGSVPESMFALPPLPEQVERRAPGKTTTRTHAALHPKIQATVKGVLAAYPDALARSMISAAEPPIPLADLKIARGGCFEFHIFGRCRIPGCAYQHSTPPTPLGETKVGALVLLLKNAASCYMRKRASGGDA